jgi:hypothetical protein
LFQTDTAIHSRKIMHTSHGGQIHHQTFPSLAQPTCDQADFLQPVPNNFSALVKLFPARQRDTIYLVRDFANEELGLTCVRRVEGCHFPTPPTTATRHIYHPPRYANNLDGTKDRAGQWGEATSIDVVCASIDNTDRLTGRHWVFDRMTDLKTTPESAGVSEHDLLFPLQGAQDGLPSFLPVTAEVATILVLLIPV